MATTNADRRPRLLDGIDLRSLPLTPEDAFVLSRVDGIASEEDIAMATGLLHATNSGNPLIIIGDKIQPKPYLVALMQQLRAVNALLEPDDRIKYAVCNDSSDVALALKKYLDSVKMILIGPGLRGNSVLPA